MIELTVHWVQKHKAQSKLTFHLDILTTLKRIYLKEERQKVAKQIKHNYST